MSEEARQFSAGEQPKEEAVEEVVEEAAEEVQAHLPVPASDPISRYMSTLQGRVEAFSDKFDKFADYIAPRNMDEDQAPENLARGPIVFGMLMLIAIFGVFGLWSAVAPIDSAAIAPGHISLDANKKTIDHLEGGIVEDIFVTEGELVKEGQVLVRLDDTAVKARQQLYKGQFIAAWASEARLIAERDNKEEIPFSEELLAAENDDPDVRANLDSQRRLFKTRRESLEGKLGVLTQKVKQYEEEIHGLEEQIRSADKQMRLLQEEIADVRFLLKKGNAPKTRLLALERRYAEIKGEKGNDQAMISRANQSINETKIQMYNLKTEMLNDVVAELKETQVKLSDLEEQMRAADNVVERVEIKAPIAGKVTGLAVHTKGGAIAPNEVLMDIVPTDDKLIVEARISPQDIDVVQVGLMARVRLLAYKMRFVPPVEGMVTIISADRFEDQRTGEAYFVARIEIDEEQLNKLDNVKLSPGMPAEVLMVTGSRSLFSYLMTPISASFNRAFREE